jgi:hypothetical protein
LFSSHLPGNGRLDIRGNKWIDNGTSIQLAKKTSGTNVVYDFTLKCNQFKLTCAEVANVALTDPDPCGAAGIPLRKGLVIGAGVQVQAASDGSFVSDQIGGSNNYDSNTPTIAYPNANEWPVFAYWSGNNRSALPIGGSGEIQTDWWSPVNWTSVSNLSGNSIKYYRYSNEFVQTGSVEDLNVFYTEPLFRVKTQGTIINTSLSYDDACQNLITDDHHIFPTRIAVVDSSDFFTGLKDNTALGGWLGEASPNPAQFETRIRVKIPISEELAILQFTEIGTGKVLSTKILSERGTLDVVLDTRQIASGTYLYRVVLKDRILGPKKLFVSK